MPQRQLKQWISLVSVGLGIVGLVVLVVYRIQHNSLPHWDLLILTYGLMYTFALPFHWIGQQASRFRSDRDALSPRPRPLANPPAGQRLAVPIPFVRLEDIRLERVSGQRVLEFQNLLDEAATELSALAGRRPALDEDGHVVGCSATSWMQDKSYHLFLIRFHDEMCGCVIVRTQPAGSELVLVFVTPAWRGRGVGLTILGRVADFVRLLGESDLLAASVSNVNARGRTFLEAGGFVERKEWGGSFLSALGTQDGEGSLHFVLPLLQSANSKA